MINRKQSSTAGYIDTSSHRYVETAGYATTIYDQIQNDQQYADLRCPSVLYASIMEENGVVQCDDRDNEYINQHDVVGDAVMYSQLAGADEAADAETVVISNAQANIYCNWRMW